MKIPRTIDEILGYFKGLTFHEVDLSLSLCHLFTPAYVWNTLSVNQRNDWIYRLLRIKPIFFYRFRKCGHLTFEIPQADYLLLSLGVPRTTFLSFPVLDNLAPSSRMILYTGPKNIEETNNIPFFNLGEIPYSSTEWQKSVSAMWKKIRERLSDFQRDFNPNHVQTYSIFNTLCFSIATVLKAEYLFEKTQPRLVFSEQDRKYPEAIIIQVARKMGIPSATLVHGLRGGGSFLSSLHVPLIADRLVAWGEWMRQDFIQMGASKDQILVGGYPRIHSILPEDRKKARELLDAQGGSRGMQVVVMLSCSFGEEKPAVEMFMDAQKLTPGYYFMVRPHPGEDLTWYETHLPDGLQRVQDPRRWSLPQSLAIADVAAGTGSTACIDAILVGTPLILIKDSMLDFTNIPMLQEAVDRKVVAIAANADDLARLLQQRSKNVENTQTIAQECAACLGADAARLTAEVLQKFARYQG